MCGIAGVAAEKIGPAERIVLEGMVRALRHRGPDDAGTFADDHVALGHVRLSIIDLAGGTQPMCNEDAGLWIVFNGEIFNYLELRGELLARGHRLATRSDTEVILHLYEDFGERCVERLNGQWAFAIWDVRAQTLFFSRDRLGVRPLFYTFPRRGQLVFASEIKALFTHPEVRRVLDPKALEEIFTFWHTLPPRTAFQDVFELPPGCSATFARGRLTVKPYWDLRYSPAAASAAAGEVERYGEQLLALLEDAVRLRLRSDVPVGAYLSGGLDSTLVARLVQRSGVARLRTFSVRFEDWDLDEGAFQAEAVQRLGAEHQEIRCTAPQIGSVFPDVVWHVEKPILRTAPAPLFLLSALVRRNGYKVVLTGEGADEMLGGYDIFKEVKIRSFWAARPDSALRPLLLRRLYPYLPQLQSQSQAYLKAFFHIKPEDTNSLFFSHLPRWRLTSKLKGFLSPDIKAALDGYDVLATLRALLPAEYKNWDPFTRAQYLEARFLLPGYILSSQGDRVAMAHAVEGRFPFLDYRVVEFCAALPAGLKMKALREKYLLKRCARPLVPDAILRRPKQPYRAPEARSFLCGHGQDYLAELLSPARLRQDGVFHPEAVELLLRKARSADRLGAADNMAVVALVSTQILLDRFIRHFNIGGRL